jgi:hypothetical protein
MKSKVERAVDELLEQASPRRMVEGSSVDTVAELLSDTIDVALDGVEDAFVESWQANDDLSSSELQALMREVFEEAFGGIFGAFYENITMYSEGWEQGEHLDAMGEAVDMVVSRLRAGASSAFGRGVASLNGAVGAIRRVVSKLKNQTRPNSPTIKAAARKIYAAGEAQGVSWSM